MLRGTASDMKWAAIACMDTLRGAGVGELGAYDRATRHALDMLVALEAQGESVDRLLMELADAELEGFGRRILPDPDVARRACGPRHPAVSA
jgi:hypothetical protein